MRSQGISPLVAQIFIVDVLLTPLALVAASWLRAVVPLGAGGALAEELVRLPWFVYILAVACWSGSLILGRAYDPERVLRWYAEAVRVVLSGMMATVLFAGALYVSFREMSRLQFVYFYAINLGFLLAHRALLRIYYRLVGRTRPGWRSRILILGAGDLGRRVAEVVLDHSRWGYDLVGFLDDDVAKRDASFRGLPVHGSIDELPRVIATHRVEEIWTALPTRAQDRLDWIVSTCETLPVHVKIVPDYFSLALVRAKTEVLAGIPLIGLREPVIEGAPRLLKRVFDLVFVVGTLVVLGPALGIIALWIRIDSPGPVLFRQQRLGENGRPFEMLKFRTMVAEAEQRQTEVLTATSNGHVLHKHRDDPRVTRVGRFLRRYSLDELPQLFNVLRGDMSLVGPRPELPWLVDRYEPWQRKRFAVPQGITGWWQINGRSDKPMHMNTEDDLYYVYNYSLWLDILILLRTPWAVLLGQGAF